MPAPRARPLAIMRTRLVGAQQAILGGELPEMHALQGKKLIAMDGSETDQNDRVMREILRFISIP